MLLIKVFGIRGKYLKAKPIYQTDKVNRFLNKLNIEQLSFEKIKSNNVYSIYDEVETFSKEIVGHENAKLYESVLLKMLPDKKDLAVKIRIYLLSILQARLMDLATLVFFSNYYNNERGCKTLIFIYNDYFSRTYSKKYVNIINIYPRWLSWLKIFSNSTRKLLVLFFNQAKFRLFGKKNKIYNLKKNNKIKETVDIKEFKVGFYPHKGIWYSELYIKDFFYSKEGSNFNKKSILHISDGESEDVLHNSYQYYEDNEIYNVDINDVASISKIQRLFHMFDFIKVVVLKSKKIEFSLLNIYMICYLQIIDAIKKIDMFVNLKVMLVGYDILFPKYYSIACYLKNIKVVAIQDRFVLAWTPIHMVIADYYFVYGEEASKEIIGNDKCDVENIYEVGPVRSDMILESEKLNNELLKERKIGEFRKVILVLDFHSATTVYENNLLHVNHWENNKRFYEDIINIAKNNEDCFFLIKGKNHDFLKLKIFSDIIKKIKKASNIYIITNYKKWTPYVCAATADIAIALHTSLGDEMLAAGKPVIFYDYSGFPSHFFKYNGFPVIAYSYNELVIKLRDAINDDLMDKSQFLMLRKKYYSLPCEKNIKHKINEKLEDILLGNML